MKNKAPINWAITVPLAWVLVSLIWAVAVYLMTRERQRAQVELARLASAEKSRRG